MKRRLIYLCWNEESICQRRRLENKKDECRDGGKAFGSSMDMLYIRDAKTSAYAWKTLQIAFRPKGIIQKLGLCTENRSIMSELTEKLTRILESMLTFASLKATETSKSKKGTNGKKLRFRTLGLAQTFPILRKSWIIC